MTTKLQKQTRITCPMCTRGNHVLPSRARPLPSQSPPPRPTPSKERPPAPTVSPGRTAELGFQMEKPGKNESLPRPGHHLKTVSVSMGTRHTERVTEQIFRNLQ